MPIVVGVSFKKVGKVYYFDPAEHDLHEGECVIAETARGIEFGHVVIEPKEVPESEIVPPLRKVTRKATLQDIEREESNRQKEKHAYAVCQDRVHAHNLAMKLIEADYCFDGSQVTFYFSADTRIDFRELVKDLASALRTRVQLHQVGVRDEAKLFGGLGPCGRVLCCSSFLSGFDPVSMKMAKEQSLFLNPLKFSGICGKLMCCLRFEYDSYKEMKSNLPSVGSRIDTKHGSGKVTEVDVIKGVLCFQTDEGSTVQCMVDDLGLGEPYECPNAQNGGCNGCGKDRQESTPQVQEPQRAKPQETTVEPQPAEAKASGEATADQSPAGGSRRSSRRGRSGGRRRSSRKRKSE